VLHDPGASFLTWSRKSKLVPRGLIVAADRQRLVITEAPKDEWEAIKPGFFDQRIPLEPIEVSFGLAHPEMALLHAALPPALRLPPWCCFTVTIRSQPRHLLSADPEVALSCVLGLKELASRLLRLPSPHRSPSRHARTPGDDDPTAGNTPASRTPMSPNLSSRGSRGLLTPARPGSALGNEPSAECELLWERARMRLAVAAQREGERRSKLLAAAVTRALSEERGGAPA